MGVHDEQTTVSAEAMPDGSSAGSSGDGTPPGGKKPSTLRRILKWTLRVLGVLLLLIGLLIGWLHTGWGQNFVRETIQERVTERLQKGGGGSFALGELDFALFGDVDLGAVTFTAKDGKTTAKVAKLHVELSWWSLLSDEIVVEKIALDGVVADVAAREATAEPKPPEAEKPAEPPADRTIRIDALEVANVDLTLHRPDGTTVAIDDFGVSAGIVANAFRKKTELKDAKITIGGITLKRPGPNDTTAVELVVGPVSTGSQAIIDGDRVQAKWSGVDVEATLTRPPAEAGKPPQVVKFPVRFSGITVDRTGGEVSLKIGDLNAGGVSLASIEAALSLDMKALAPIPTNDQSFKISGLKLSADDINALLPEPRLASDVTVDFTAVGPPNKMALTGDVKTAGGTLGLRGTVDISDPLMPTYDLTISAPNVETAKILTGGNLPDTKTSLTVTIKGKGRAMADMNTAVSVQVGETQVGARKVEGVTIEAQLEGGKVNVKDLTLKVLGHAVRLDGDFDPESRRVKAHFTTSADLDNLVKRLNESGLLKAPLPPIKGQDFTVDIKAEAVLPPPAAATPSGPDTQTSAAAPAKPNPLAQLQAVDSQMKGAVSASNLDNGRVKVGKLAVDVDMAVAKAVPKGKVSVAIDKLATVTGVRLDKVRATVTLDGTVYRVVIDAEDPKTKRKLHATASGTIDPETMDIAATLEALDEQLGDFKANLAAPVTIDLPPGLDVAGKTVRLPPTKLNVAGGTVTVRGGARLSEKVEGQQPKVQSMDADIEVDGVRVSRLPARVRRRLRGVSGKLDATVSVRGTPTDPSLSFSVSTAAR